jgi:sigma54-dependent transcription regulator
MLTIEELKENLIKVDEITLMEALEVSSEDLVENFDYIIEENYYKLHELVMGYGMEEEEEDLYDENLD